MKVNKNIVVNSTILYVIAFLLTTINHEFAHALVGMMYKSAPVLHHNYVQHFSNEVLPVQQQVMIALAGPFMSLFQGITIGIIYIKFQKQRLFDLFLLWFSILGLFNFLGYLMTGFLFKVGDIGKAFLLLETPFWIQIVVALLGATCLVFVAYKLTAPFLSFAYEYKLVESKPARKKFSFQILILPWIIGSVIMTLLYFPIIAVISIIYPVMSGFIFIFPWQNAETIENVRLSDYLTIGRISVFALSFLICLILIFRFILAPGVQLF